MLVSGARSFVSLGGEGGLVRLLRAFKFETKRSQGLECGLDKAPRVQRTK